MKPIAFIHARSGSKRIPGKNVKSFLGKPALSYPLKAAIDSGLFSDVYISTDSEDIADKAIKLGAKLLGLRPDLLSDDMSTTSDVILYDLKEAQKKGVLPHKVCILYGTAVFTTPDLIAEGLNLINERNAKMSYPVTEFEYPVYRAYKKNSAGFAEPVFPEFINHRSQDLPHAFHDVGLFYWVDSQKFLEEPDLICGAMAPFSIPKFTSQDIDEPADWHRAEFLYQSLNR